jgi:aminoglycoside phosphotransferase (APT) family kinase protein
MHATHLIALIGTGASADVFRVAGGRVIKLFHESVHPGLMAREHDGASRAFAAGLPVARPIGWESIDGRTGIVFEELEGRPLIGSAPPWRIGRLRGALEKLARCHAEIHRCGADGLAYRQHDMLRARIERADVDPALRDAALARLAALPPGDRLCHGDLHPGNVIEGANGIAAVDWANASIGDPAADVVRTELLLRYGRYGRTLRRFPPLRLLRQQAARHYLKHYRRAAAPTMLRIAAWWLPVAVSCLVRPSHIDRAALLADPRLRHV